MHQYKLKSSELKNRIVKLLYEALFNVPSSKYISFHFIYLRDFHIDFVKSNVTGLERTY